MIALAAPLKLALAVLASAAAQQSPNVDWRSIQRNDHGEVFVDPSSVRRDGATFTIMERLVPARDRNGTYSMITVARFDCVRRTHALLRQTQLSADGTILYEGGESVPRDRNVSAGSAAATILSQFCPR